MIDGILFDKLEYIARNLRNDGSPFGGIQVQGRPSNATVYLLTLSSYSW
jgi:hypothetical protein